MEWLVFGAFLLISAGEDLRRKAVDVRVYLIFGFLAIGLAGWRAASASSGGWELAGDACIGAALGAGLLAAGRVSAGGVGVGDGLFFCISGVYLGFWNNLLLLVLSSLCCGLFCLGYYVWGRLWQGRGWGEKTVPFLAFTAIPGIWMTAEAVGRMWEARGG